MRQSRLWLIVVAVVFIAMLGGSIYAQRTRKARAEAELAAIEPQYQQAVDQNLRLAETQARLNKARDVARLYTYLRHPWPRTQLLAAVVAPLPEGVTLDELQITREAAQDVAASERHSKKESETKAKDVEKMPPAARDLCSSAMRPIARRPWCSCSARPTTAMPCITTSAQLGTCDLFDKAELDWLDTAENSHDGTLQFRGPDRPPGLRTTRWPHRKHDEGRDAYRSSQQLSDPYRQ